MTASSGWEFGEKTFVEDGKPKNVFSGVKFFSPPAGIEGWKTILKIKFQKRFFHRSTGVVEEGETSFPNAL